MLTPTGTLRTALMAAIGIAASAALASCGPPASKGGFDSPNPAARMYAIEYAVRPETNDGVRPDREFASRRERGEGRSSWRTDRPDGSADGERGRSSTDRRRGRDTIPRLIEQLESDDPAIRMMAIGALERLTGETHGYRHYDPRHERQAAVEQWRQAFEAGDLVPTRTTSPERGADDDE